MTTSITIKVVVLATVTALCHGQGQGQDSTLTPEARGPSVVDAVVDRIRTRCVFPEDRLFLRRVAYVVSRDGQNSDTYRPNFDGGIWQITEAQLQTTQDCTNQYLQDACNTIQTEFSIDWPNAAWSDLRKPLYSGLAAALLTLLELAGADMPGSVADQADLWVRMYGGDANTFSSVAEDATKLEECSDKLELVFILDASGSVSFANFNLTRQFAADVVEVMDVSPDTVRVAAVVFSSSAYLHFGLTNFSTKAEVRDALLQTPKISGGTDTAEALMLATSTLDVSAGARPDAKKVAVLITDGFSGNPSATSSAAQTLRDQGVTVFAVGIGNYRLQELQAVASDPDCWHVLTLTSFDKITSILTQIQKSACEVSVVLTNNTDVEQVIDVNGTVTTIITTAPNDTSTIEANVSCGILDLYVSTTDPRPSPAVYDVSYHATPEVPAMLTIVETLPEGTLVYITVVATRFPPTVAALHNCSDYNWTIQVVPIKNVTVVCVENGVERNCTKADVDREGLCPTDDYPVINPCTTENLVNNVLRHPYPYDPTKFLMCDMSGNYYITPCSNYSSFNPNTRECGFTSVGVGGDVGQTGCGGGASNPCTAANIMAHQFYHVYSSDVTKFIQCDEWGTMWIRNCAPGTQWSQPHLTCIHLSSPVSPTCGAGVYSMVDPCDHSRFYSCSGGVAYSMPCPTGLFFHPGLGVCGFDDVNTDAIPASCGGSG